MNHTRRASSNEESQADATALRCITIQQPWAWAIFHGKTVVNRTQQWSYRGPIGIHAGNRWSDRGGACELVDQAWNDATTGCTTAEYSHTSRIWTARGEIIGVADLVDVHPEIGNCCQPWGESAQVAHGGRRRRRITHLVLENARSLPEPIPCRGALGLWIPPADIIERLRVATTTNQPAVNHQ
ncbi:hypothetical protein [Mycolicibacterium alvei]|uniref:ASCH domain-containing protein n=1 Tax=Mycolicibacterium alvei TaxID=67081 RepID=A0A6N4V1M8_9MYCO|nr:hypothetical protein [Mycolicibacterium alvei]BBX30488.1 hypothetical protein MALV_56130 [Mycolicibacterium alvei]